MRKLVAGPLTLEYSEGSLWNISNGSEEAIRRIYLVFQDINWTSRPFIIKDEIWLFHGCLLLFATTNHIPHNMYILFGIMKF